MLGFWSALLVAVPLASAGDQALYERALSLIQEHYLHPEAIDASRMFADAGRQAATRIEWLGVRVDGDTLHLSEGDGRGGADVRLESAADLAPALSRLEDAIRATGLPIDPQVDVRIELLRGVVHSLDRHTTVLYATGLERFDERLSGTLSGIGATIGVESARLVVRALVPGGPAERGGLETGDVVHKINGLSTLGMDNAAATKRIRGPAGSTIVLTVQRGAQMVDLTLVRDEVHIRNVTSSVAPNGVGVVKIDHFSELTHTYLEESLQELAARRTLTPGLLVDLRGNTGGSLLQSADAADTFLPSGTIVTTVGRDGSPVAGLIPRLDATADRTSYRMPIAVVMDHETASGSEILAGSLASLGRALLVGTTSYGKGTVQKVYEIDPQVKLKLTVAEYLVRGHDHVANIGLAPDVAVEPVRFDASGAWWPAPDREAERFAPGTPIIRAAAEEVGWRINGMTPPPRDAALEVASSLVAAAEGPTREDLLATARLLAPKLAAIEDARLVETFGARGIDWSPRPPDAPELPPLVHARLDARGDIRAGLPVEIAVSVRNEGPTLYRAAIRLRSADPLWDDRVLPLGQLRTGTAGVGTATVTIPAAAASRMDDVEMFLEADGVPARSIGRADLSVVGAPPPRLVATLRSARANDVVTVSFDVQNEGETALSGLVARFAFPDQDGVELLDGGSPPADLAPHTNARGTLRLRVAPTWTGSSLPLDLVLEAPEPGLVARWGLDLPLDGGTLRLDPPVLTARASAVEQAPGTATLQIRASDDRALDHVVVLGGVEDMDRTRYAPALLWEPDKLAWRPTTGRKLDLSLAVEILPGLNRFDVVAQDRTGLRTTQTVYVLGRQGLPVDAVDGDEPAP